MSYGQLLVALQGLTLEQLEKDVTLYNRSNDEYYPIESFRETTIEDDGVLDDEHPVIVFKE
jgi:hypothetical protein